MKVTYGADPEFFVQEIKSGQIVPACGLFGGAKKAPIFLSDHGGFLEDGVSIEFNVRPQNSLEELIGRLQELMALWEVQHPGYLLVPGAAAYMFGDKMLRKYPQALVLGCEADLWFYGIRKMPQVNEMRGRRFTGGHLHLGFEGLPAPWTAEDIIPLLDLLILGPATKRSNPERWKFYGHPGLYRPTGYGVEYRSLDNWWVTPKEHPLVLKEEYSKIRSWVDYWNRSFESMWAFLDKNDPEKSLDATKRYFEGYELGDYLSSHKITQNPGYAQGLYEHSEKFKSHMRVVGFFI